MASDQSVTASLFPAKAVYPTDDGKIAHAELRFGNGILMFGSRRDDPGNPWSTVDFGIYVAVDDVDAHHARAAAAGAEIVKPPHDTDYGSREYHARDCEGRLWSFGTYRP